MLSCVGYFNSDDFAHVIVVHRHQHLLIVLIVTDVADVIVGPFRHQHFLHLAQLVRVRVVRLEPVRQFFRSLFYFLRWNFRHFRRRRPRPRVELVDEQRGELVLLAERHGFLKIFFRFRRKSADYVRRHG